MATIRDVAKLAGVSIATVSNFLNQSKPVSHTAAERIKSAAAELQYTPNAAAKSLRGQKNREIGILLPSLDDPYYVQVFQGIEKAFSGSSYFLNVAFTDDLPTLERQNLQNFLSKRICGLILVSCQPDEWKYYYDNFTSQGVPMVMLDRRIKALDANCVLVECGGSIRRITAALLAGGFRDLYLFSGPERFTCEESCIRAFRDAYLHAGLPVRPQQLVQSPITKEHAFAGTIRLLKATRPDAILTTSSLLATGVIEGLHLLGYAEADIPVVTLGEEHWNKYTQGLATLSTARPAIKAGDTAAQLLLGQLGSPLRDTEQVTLYDATQPKMLQKLAGLCRPAPAPREAEKPVLRILMLDNPSVRVFQGLIRNFEQRFGVRTELRFLPHHAIFNEIQSASDTYDVMMFDVPWLSLLASSGVLADITDDLAPDAVAQFFPNCLRDYGLYRRRVYGIPFMYAPQMLYYRRDLFEDPALRTLFEHETGASLRPPLTLKEYNTIAAFFTQKTDAVDYGVSVAAAYNECFAPEIYFRLQTFQSQIFDESGAVAFDSPQTLKAYINFKRTIHFAKPDYLHATDVSIIDDFVRGETAMLITYPAFISNGLNLRENSKLFGYAMVPGRRPLLGGWSFGVSRQSRCRALALAFLHWTCDEDISNYFTIMGGQTAISSTYTNDEMVKLYPWLPIYFKAYPCTSPETISAAYMGDPLPSQQIDNIICKWAYKCLIYNMEISEAIAQTQRELQALSERR